MNIGLHLLDIRLFLDISIMEYLYHNIICFTDGSGVL